MKPYTLGLYEKAMPKELEWEEKLVEAKQTGFDFLEISIDETDEKLERLNMDSSSRLHLVKLMDKTNLPIRTMCLSGHRKYPMGSLNEKTRFRSMEIMRKAIDLADDLGIRVIQLAGYDVYYENSNDKTKKYFEENLKKAVEMAASKNVTLGFETMETEFMNTVEKSMEYVQKIKSTYLGVYPDLGNITNAAKRYGHSVERDIYAGVGHLTSMHLKETVPGKFREIPFGHGHVDFESGIKAAWISGVRRYVTEFWYTGSNEWKNDLSKANNMMREILDRQ